VDVMRGELVEKELDILIERSVSERGGRSRRAGSDLEGVCSPVRSPPSGSQPPSLVWLLRAPGGLPEGEG
jgi:hypothetical protein